MIVAIICPKCKEMITETYPHPLNMPCFVCRECRLILEPPNGMREEISTTPLEGGSILPSRLPWDDGRAREKNWIGSKAWKDWKHSQSAR